MKVFSAISSKFQASRDGKGATRRTAMTLALFVALAASLASAQIPYETDYSGRLTNALGVPLVGPVSLTVRIFDQTQGGAALYVEAHANVALDDGFFRVAIGGGAVTVGNYEPTLFGGIRRYIEIAVDGATLSPRQAIGSVPYAMQTELSQQASQADAANDSARLQGSTLADVLATAQANAAPAQTTADSALANAATAQGTADTAVANAATAEGTADTAVTNAAAAQGTADTALGNAATAQETANTATAALTAAGIADGNIDLDPSTAATGNLLKNGIRFLHNYGSNNTFLGENAGNFTVAGSSNVAIGLQALNNVAAGSSNVAIGSAALLYSEGGVSNVAVGANAMRNSTLGSQNVGIGTSALSNTTGSRNVAAGFNALVSNTDGYDNVAIGTSALYSNVGDEAADDGQDNVAIGSEALYSNLSGSGNVAVGANALRDATRDENTAIGAGAMASGEGGYRNVAIGKSALGQNDGGRNNVAIGVEALYSNNYIWWLDGGSDNVAIGRQALYASTEGEENVAIGSQAMESHTTGRRNVAIGHRVMDSHTGGHGNVAVGHTALQTNTNSGGNVAIGDHALSASDADFNTGIGYWALNRNTTGARNVGLGRFAGFNGTTGNDNIYLGTDVEGVAGESNTMYLGLVGRQTRAFLAGTRGTTTANADAVAVLIDSAGQLGTASSSRSSKRAIADMGDRSQVLQRLRPVSFEYRSHPEGGPKQYGLIAEEVAAVAPDLVVYDGDGRPETVQYRKVNALLLNEVQRQQAQIDALRERLAALEQQRPPH